MKNKDMPASPTPYMDLNHQGGELHCDQQGLTKREMFAMNAPDIPVWFIDDWINNNEDREIIGTHEIIGRSRGARITSVEMMQIIKACLC